VIIGAPPVIEKKDEKKNGEKEVEKKNGEKEVEKKKEDEELTAAR
jgi:hypothetical protein